MYKTIISMCTYAHSDSGYSDSWLNTHSDVQLTTYIAAQMT